MSACYERAMTESGHKHDMNAPDWAQSICHILGCTEKGIPCFIGDGAHGQRMGQMGWGTLMFTLFVFAMIPASLSFLCLLMKVSLLLRFHS